MVQAVIPGVNSGNSRERRIRVFLASVPKRAHRLVLSASSDDGPVPLAEWQTVEISEELEPLISQALDELAAEAESTADIHVTLAYVDEAGEVVTVLRLRARRRDGLAEAARAVPAFTPNGSNVNQATMAQGQQLQMHKLQVAAIVTVMQQSERLLERSDRMNERVLEMLDRMGDRLAHAEVRVEERDAELDEMARAVREAQAAVQTAPPGSAARTNAENLFKSLVTPDVVATVVARLLGVGSQPPQLPRAEPPSPPADEGPERVD